MTKIVVTPVNENLTHASNGEVVLYKRGYSKLWQDCFKFKGLKWHRFATEQVNIQFATEISSKDFPREDLLQVFVTHFGRPPPLNRANWDDETTAEIEHG